MAITKEEITMSPSQPTSLLKNRDFMLLWSGQVVSTLGTESSSLVYPLLILALTNSPTTAGIAGALQTIPYLLFSLPAGALIDRWDRKRTMILCDIGRGLLVAGIALAVLFDFLTVWQIYLTALLDGSLFVLFNIAELVALTRVVPKAQLPQASSLNEAAFGAVTITAPTFGTFLYGALGRAVPFVFDAISYVVSVTSLFFIHTSFQEQRVVTTRNLRREIADGLHWLWRQPVIRYLAVLAGGMNFTVSSVPLIVIVAAKHMGAADAQIGLMFSMAGIGGIIGSWIGARVQNHLTFGQTITMVVWGVGLLYVFYSLVPQFLLLGVIAGLSFMLITIYNVLSISYRLARIPEELQGRVNSAFRFLAFAFRPLGMAICGFLLDHLGTTLTIILFATFLLVLALFTTFNPDIQRACPMDHATID